MSKGRPNEGGPSGTAYRVVPSAEGWTVTRNGGFAASFDTREVALTYARTRARVDRLEGKPSQVIVHRADSTVEKEWTFEPD
jgi:hypothetical protein